MSSETEREAPLPGDIDQAIVSLRDAEWESGLHRDPLKSAVARACDRVLRSEIRAALAAAHPAEPPRTVTGDGAGELPPRPTSEEAAVPATLERWGRGPEGTPYLLQQRDDGYWTPWHVAEAAVAQALKEQAEEPFQARVEPWLLTCFAAKIAADTSERNHRFLEESLELVQACGCTRSEAHQLVDYVFGRAVGEKAQEVGGVMVTLAALCLAQGLDMHEAGEAELERIWTKVEAIRAKQAAKPKHSPLPQAVQPGAAALTDEQIDNHLNVVLRAAGSALKYYDSPKTIAAMREAMRAVLAAAKP